MEEIDLDLTHSTTQRTAKLNMEQYKQIAAQYNTQQRKSQHYTQCSPSESAQISITSRPSGGFAERLDGLYQCFPRIDVHTCTTVSENLYRV